MGWVYQLSDGCQGESQCLATKQLWHINAKELAIPWLFLCQHPSIWSIAVCLLMDNKVAMCFTNKKGSSRLIVLLRLSECISQGKKVRAHFDGDVPVGSHQWSGTFDVHCSSHVSALTVDWNQ